MKHNKFNVRVYGIVLKQDAVLITDEIRAGVKMTKFPGGGVEFGEGLKDALVREFREELGIEVKVGNLFYVNDFFQQSAFNNNEQLISFYFLVKKINGNINVVDYPFDIKEPYSQCFRWVKKSHLFMENITFPVDDVVAKKLQKKV